MNFWHLKGSGQDLKILLKSKNTNLYPTFDPYFAHLSVLSLSQKHGDDQFLHDFVTTYIIY